MIYAYLLIRTYVSPNYDILIFQYAPVTMVIVTSGHQIRCIVWEQEAIFNKEIGVYVD